MKREREIFKLIPGYSDYAVSNYGNVKSIRYNRILKPTINNKLGYYYVTLCSNGKRKIFTIHQLVAMVFLDHIPNGHKIVVDHIDNDPLNNRLDNLQLISNRENTSKDKFRKKTSSKYVGVYLCRQKYKRVDGSIKIYESWKAQIRIDGKNINLGLFKTQEKAAEAYQNKLEEINK